MATSCDSVGQTLCLRSGCNSNHGKETAPSRAEPAAGTAADPALRRAKSELQPDVSLCRLTAWLGNALRAAKPRRCGLRSAHDGRASRRDASTAGRYLDPLPVYVVNVHYGLVTLMARRACLGSGAERSRMGPYRCSSEVRTKPKAAGDIGLVVLPIGRHPSAEFTLAARTSEAERAQGKLIGRSLRERRDRSLYFDIPAYGLDGIPQRGYLLLSAYL